MAVKTYFLVTVFLMPVGQLFEKPDPRPPLYGLWEVQEFERAGVPVPALRTEPHRWLRLTVVRPERMHVYGMTGQRWRMASKLDEKAGTLVLSEPDEKNPEEDDTIESTFSLDRDGERLILTGEFRGQSVRITLERKEPEFVLTTRGFNWINEYPFSR